jgi:adhesin/invasin
VHLKDQYGNNLVASGGTVTLAKTAGNLTAVTDNNNGTYTATLTSATTAGASTITGKIGAASITDNEVVTFTPGAATTANSTIAVSPASIVANGITSSTITVQLKDANNNNLTATGGTVTLTTTLGTLGGVSDNSNGTYTATLTSATTTGTAIINGKLNTISLTDSKTVAFTPGTAVIGTSTITASPLSIVADNVTTSTITVQLKDQFGNNLNTSGGVVTLSTTSGTLSAVTDKNDGTYTAILTSATIIGTATISGKVNGSLITSTATVTFTPGVAVTGTSTIAVSPNSITADGASTATVTVQLNDAYGNNLTTNGGTVVISSAGGSVGTTSYTSNGQYRGTITAPTLVGGPYTVSATLGGSPITATTSITFVPGDGTIQNSTVSVDHSTIIADGTSTATVTVQLKDAFSNNLISNIGTVAISCTGGTVGTTGYIGNGQYQAIITSSKIAGGPYVISATLGGSRLSQTTNISFLPGPVSPGTSVINVTPNLIIANGFSTAIATVQMKDVNGNNLTTNGGAVVISCNGGTVVNNGYINNGQYQATITSSDIIGPYIVSFTLNGSSVGTATANISFIAGTVKITYRITGYQLKVQVDNLAYDHAELTVDSRTAVTGKADINGATAFTLPQETGLYTLKIRVYYTMSNGSNYYSDPIIVIYAVRPRYVPGKGDGFGWEMWK